MSKQTETNLFIGSSLKQVGEFYQHLLEGITTYDELGTRLLRQIRTAYAFRQVERVAELSRILIRVPLKEYRLIARYYLVWCQFRVANCYDEALDSIIEQTQTYRSKALISRGTFELYKGKPERALFFYSESLKANPSFPDYIVASRAIATARSSEGFHRTALKDLECLLPLLKYAEPLTYCEVLNSYAVELIEMNRLSEAENVSRLVVSSPFAPYYPEWRETREDISGRRVSRSSVTSSAGIVPEPTTLLHMPLRERSSSEPFTAQQRAVVFDMQEWKKRKMTNHDERPPKPTTSAEKQARLKEVEKLGGREVLMQIMTALADESVGEDLLRKALAVLEGLDEG